VTKLFTAFLVLYGLAGGAAAQDTASSFTFYYRVTNPPNLNPVTPLSTVTFPDTAIGKTTALTFLVQTAQASTSAYTIMNPSVSGTGFSLAQQSGTVPAQANGFGTIAINFTPTTGDFSNGTLQFSLVGPTGLTFNFTFTLFGRVISPKVVTSYSLSSTNDQVSIRPGDTIPFPNTALNATSQATSQASFIVANSGTGPATVDSVSITGDAYKLGNLSLVPAAVAGGSDFRFTIIFAPLAAKRYAGTLNVSINGTPGTYSLDGLGSSALFSYRTITGSTTKTIAPGATVTLPDTPADGATKSTVTIQVTNDGNAAGTLANINLSGSDFTLANQPALPKTLNPASSTFFDIVYQPAKPGPSTGRLQVGDDVFPLAANGLGAVLSVAVDVGTGATPVLNKGTIAVPNTAVGARRSVFVTVTNSGNQAATVSSFSAAGPVFTTLAGPSLPAALAPGQTQRFEVRFAPVSTGAVTATLAVNDQTFTLLGAGDSPPALPAVTITGAGAQTDPLQQPAAAVQLASAYPADLKGVITLAFLSDTFADDPAIQFANGTRTVNFTIPANTTQAVFNQLGRTAPFQTGTVSGRVVLSAAFTVGTVDVTPAAAPSISTTIPSGAPQLSSVRLGSQTGGTMQILISGYSTARSVTQLALQFTGITGSNLQTTSQNVDVSSAFTNWYADAGSRAFGSQFTLTLTLTVTGDPNALQTVAVTASNAQGTSASKAVALR